MLRLFPSLEILLCSNMQLRRECPVGKAGGDYLNRLLGRMQHIRIIEAIVAELIEHNLVGREISRPRKFLHQGICQKQ